MKGFKFLHHNEELCHSHSNKTKTITNDNLLLILIHSSPDNLEYRNLIRKTWGSLTFVEDWNIKYAFLIGIFQSSQDSEYNNDSSDSTIKSSSQIAQIKNQIYQESEEEQDLIVGNFVDTYKNLGYKQMMGYKWAIKYCSEAKFVLKTDSDVFVNIFELVKKVKMIITSESMNQKSSKIIACPVNYGTPVERDPDSTWFVSKKEYSNEKYPDYCWGMGFLLSFNVLEDLVKASEQVPFVWVDDAYVTGILREFLSNRFGTRHNVKFLDIRNIYVFSNSNLFFSWLYRNKSLKEERKLPWIFVHCSTEDISIHFELLWKYLLESYKYKGFRH